MPRLPAVMRDTKIVWRWAAPNRVIGATSQAT